MRWKLPTFCLLSLLLAMPVWADDPAPGYTTVKCNGSAVTKRRKINFTTSSTCQDDSANGETDVTIGAGGASNSFETISTPAGTAPVADSSTDTLSLTSTGGTVTITGTAGTDTINLESTGSGTPGGSNGQVQYNQGGTFGGDSSVILYPVADILGVTTLYASGSVTAQNVTAQNVVDTPVLENSGSGGSILIRDAMRLGNEKGVALTASAGTLTLTGIGNTNNEDFKIDLEGTSNQVNLSSSTGPQILQLTALSLVMQDDRSMLMGNGSDARIEWDTAETNDSLKITTDVGSAAQSGNILIVEDADLNTNFGASIRANPTLRIQSADATTTSDYLALYHDQTNPTIELGNGTLQIIGGDILAAYDVTGISVKATQTVTAQSVVDTPAIESASGSVIIVRDALNANGSVTGSQLASTAIKCHGTDKLTTDGGGNVVCAADQTGGGSSHAVLSATHTDSVANAVSRGSLIAGNSTPAWDELTVGSANSVLTADGTDVAWDTTPAVASLTSTGSVTGSQLASTTIKCTSPYKLTTDSNGNLVCAGDVFLITSYSTNADTDDFYQGPFFDNTNNANTSVDEWVTPYALACTSLTARTSSGASAGTTYAITAQVESANTALTCTMDGDNPDTTNYCTVTVSPPVMIPNNARVVWFWDETGSSATFNRVTATLTCYAQ